MAAQICETCKHKGKRCYCAPNSTCGAYEQKTIYYVKGHQFPQWRDYVEKTVWVRFRIMSWCEAEIDSEWLNEYKNKLHPNDEVTNMDLSTYAHYYFDIEELYRDEIPNVIDDALKAGVVGWLD